MLGRAPAQRVRDDLLRFKELMEGNGPKTPGRQAHKKRSRRGKSRIAATGRAAVRAAARAVKDAVQEASEESFPASDAPAWGSRRR
jgi:hypothetical protein